MSISRPLFFILTVMHICSPIQSMQQILQAAKSRNVEAIEHLQLSGILLETLDENSKRTALTEAAMSGDLDTMKILMQVGADINAEDGENETPLCRAATGKPLQGNKQKSKDTVFFLLNAGAKHDDLFLRRAVRRSWVMEAVKQYNEDVKSEKMAFFKEVAKALGNVSDVAGIVVEYSQNEICEYNNFAEQDPADPLRLYDYCYYNGNSCFPSCNCP